MILRDAESILDYSGHLKKITRVLRREELGGSQNQKEMKAERKLNDVTAGGQGSDVMPGATELGQPLLLILRQEHQSGLLFAFNA